MNEFAACENAYKNGYEDGCVDGVRDVITLLMLVEEKIIDGEPKTEPVGIVNMLSKTNREMQTKETE